MPPRKTRQAQPTALPPELFEDPTDPEPVPFDLTRKTQPLERPEKRAGVSPQEYGKTGSSEPCRHCTNGHLVKHGVLRTCNACDGTGVKGGHGHRHVPIPAEVYRRVSLPVPKQDIDVPTENDE